MSTVFLAADELAELFQTSTLSTKNEERKTRQLIQKISGEIKRMLHDSASVKNIHDYETKTSANEKNVQPVQSNDIRNNLEFKDNFEAVNDIGTEIPEPSREGAKPEKLHQRNFEEEGKSETASFISCSTKNAEDANEHSKRTKVSQATPYNVWNNSKRIHEKYRYTPKQIKLSEKEIQNSVCRLYKNAERTQEMLKQKRKEAAKAEMEGVNFKPKINEKSRKMAKTPPLHERTADLIRKRKERINEWRKQVSIDEISEVQEQPSLNKTKKWKPRVAHKYRKEIPRSCDKDINELTFSPVINTKSIKMVQQATKEGRRTEIWERKNKKSRATATQNINKRNHFQPKINSRSKAIPRTCKSVYERLYSMSEGKKSSEKERKDKHSNVNMVAYKDEYNFILKSIFA